MVIDLYGFTVDEVRTRFPAVYQWLVEHVKPERDHNNRESRRVNWWLFGETNPKLRHMLAGLPRYIATVETSKHRFFVFLDAAILPDNKLVNIALDDAYFLGVLSSRTHMTWALAAGGRLGVGNDPVYVKTTCFERFPFPTPTPAQRQRIRDLGEQLDAHRKRRQAAHPGLTLTDMYNVLEKLRAGEALGTKEREVHERGLVAVLREVHDALDGAVAEAYGWPAGLGEDEVLERLVALNRERAAEEARGVVRWLRPAYQAAGLPREAQGALEGVGDGRAEGARDAAAPWPKGLAEQVQATLGALAAIGRPATGDEVAAVFVGAAGAEAVGEILETLAMLGRVRAVDGGRFVGR